MALNHKRPTITITEGVNKPQNIFTPSNIQENNQNSNYDYLKEDENKNLDDFFKDEVIQKVDIHPTKNSFIQDNPFNNSTVENITNLEGLELDFTPQIAEGKYEFRVSTLNIERGVDTRYGTKDKFIIDFNIHRIEEEGLVEHNLKQKYNKSNSPYSSFYKAVTDLTGKAPTGKINARELLDVTGSCEVKFVELDDGGEFPKIINIHAHRKDVPAV